MSYGFAESTPDPAHTAGGNVPRGPQRLPRVDDLDTLKARVEGHPASDEAVTTAMTNAADLGLDEEDPKFWHSVLGQIAEYE
jgi:hypothetical protein